jgi:hypothetical protein
LKKEERIKGLIIEYIPKRVNIPLNTEKGRGTKSVELIGVKGFIGS